MSVDPEARHPGPRELLVACRGAIDATAGAPTCEERAALLVRVDVRLDPEGAVDLAPALDDAEAVFSAARAHFTTRGFVPALEASESLVLVRYAAPPVRVAAPPVRVATPDDAGAVEEFAQLIAGRPGRHPSVRVAVLSRQGTVRLAGGAPVAAHLLSAEDWTQRSKAA
jgi:hypothetical protein